MSYRVNYVRIDVDVLGREIGSVTALGTSVHYEAPHVPREGETFSYMAEMPAGIVTPVAGVVTGVVDMIHTEYYGTLSPEACNTIINVYIRPGSKKP